MDEIRIRKILPADNKPLAAIIRTSLAEFGANKPGTVYFDPTTDQLYQLFQAPGAIYFVAEENNQVIGGVGIYPSDGLPQGVCELVKMYLKAEARGKGLGKMLITKALDFARQEGYHTVYLESMPELKKALSVYERFGFTYLDGPIGNTGHFGCDVWMKKDL
jgi:putative acetyltransferase